MADDDVFELVPDESQFASMMAKFSRPADPEFVGWLEDDLVLVTDGDHAERARLVALYGRRVGYAMWLDKLLDPRR